MINASDMTKLSTNVAFINKCADILDDMSIRNTDFFEKILNHVEEKIIDAASSGKRSVCILISELAYASGLPIITIDGCPIGPDISVMTSLENVLKENNYTFKYEPNYVFENWELCIEW
jgi:hypothetical protein